VISFIFGIIIALKIYIHSQPSYNYQRIINGNIPMAKQLETLQVVKLLEAFLIETFENVQNQPLYINRNTSLFTTLAEITAEQASQPMGACATIAAHVEHIRYYLDVLEDFMFKRDVSNVDWGAIWETVSTVTDDEWQTMNDNLKASYERIKAHLNNEDVWDSIHEPSAMMGMIVHTAYHLGEIRQMMCRLRS